MSVYVDTPIDYGATEVVEGYVGRARKRARWCHMVADTEAELHAMAERIGLQRKWAQRDRHGVHYDLVPTKRLLAISYGAVAIDRRQLVEILQRAAIRTAVSATLGAWLGALVFPGVGILVGAIVGAAAAASQNSVDAERKVPLGGAPEKP